MSTLRPLALALALAPFVTHSTSAYAADSDHGRFYVQGSPLGTSLLFYPETDFSYGGTLAFYRLDLELGAHFPSSHADGLAFGVRQTFLLGHGSGGTTTARAGYDLAFPLGDQLELVVAPYLHLGVGYAFSGGDAAFHLGFGVEGRVFPSKSSGVYAMLRPVEVDFNFQSPVVPIYTVAAGVGYAF